MESDKNHPVLFGKYQILEELGRGGFGIVYRAFDTVLEVERAIKELYPNLVNDPALVSRFKQEARIAAKLDHPNLVPVYDFGQIEGKYYLAMGYMPGGSLKDLLKREGKLEPEGAYKIMAQVCDGLEYAHARGIIHRDLKPGNILFDETGKARVADMGFAKVMSEGASRSMSASGSLVGTPAYMAPEVWRNKPAQPQTDVYSLGCILYEMLTGKVLFEGDSPAEIMTMHMIDGPQYATDLPQELRPVLDRALQRDPQERFVDVKALLTGFRSGLEIEHQEPAIANEDEKVEQVNENERQAATLGVVEVLLDEILGDIELPGEPSSKDISTWIDQLENQHDLAEENIPEGTNEKRPVSKKINPAIIKVLLILGLSLLGLFLGYLVIYVNNSKTTTQQPPATTISNQLLPTSTTLHQESTPQPTATMTPTQISLLGSTVISSSNVDQVEELARLGEAEASTIAYSPDGKTLSSGNLDRSIILWDTGSGRHLRTLIANEGIVWSVAWSPNGKTLVSGGFGGTIILWDVGNGSQLRTLEGHTDVVYSIAWSPDGKTLASGNYDGIILLWDAENGAKLCTLEGHKGTITSVAWSPDGKTLASGSYDNTVILWDVISGSQLHTLEGHTNNVISVAWSPDGKTLASGNSDNTIILWDAGSGSQLRTLEGHTNAVMSVAWSPDGKTLASGSYDGTVRFWGIP